MLQNPRGTRDFSPEEMQKRKYLEEKIRKTFQNYGYKEIQTPTFENLELFTAKSGDQIIKEIYNFKDKGGRELALRPELTAPVIRFYVNKMKMEPKPLKLYYFGNCYRYDRPQKGRYREFRQAGCELIGTNTPEALAELISLAYKIFKNVGLNKLNLNIGNLNILSSIFKKIGLSKKDQNYIIPMIDKELFDDIYDALIDFEISENDAQKFLEIIRDSDIFKIEKYLDNTDEVKPEINKLKKIKGLLKDTYKIDNLNIKMSIVRGLDYYNGMVFEVEAPHLGAEKQICGGGEYELISLFGGRKTPTSGFAVGFDRTLLALEEEKYDFPSYSIDVYVIPLNEKIIEKAIEIAEQLRNIELSVDLDLLRRGVSKSLKYANSINSRFAIIIGPEELEKNQVTIKNMKSGEQKSVELDKIKDFFK